MYLVFGRLVRVDSLLLGSATATPSSFVGVVVAVTSAFNVEDSILLIQILAAPLSLTVKTTLKKVKLTICNNPEFINYKT